MRISKLYVVAELVVKIIAAALLNEKTLLDSGDIASLCTSFFKGDGDHFARYTKNELEHITIDTASMLESLLRNSSLDEDCYPAIIECINQGVKKTDLSTKAIVAYHNDAKKIAEVIFANCSDTKHMSQKEVDTVRQCCTFVARTIISAIAENARNFDLCNYEEIYKQFNELQKNLSEEMRQCITNLSIATDSVQDFEAQYLHTLSKNYNHVELFTSKIGNYSTKRYRLDVAYIELAMQSKSFANCQNVSVENLFQYGKKWIIKGEAGCGKTTLLQWLVLSVAKNQRENDEKNLLKGYFPVLITLRKVKDWNHLSLKQAIDDELYASGLNVPLSFLRSLNSTGRKLMVLIDGLDEVDYQKRYQVLNWLESLVAERDEWAKSKNEDKERRMRSRKKDPNVTAEELQELSRERYSNEMIIVLTSRPLMDEEFNNNMHTLGIKQASVLPMTYRDVCTFIDYWHKAISHGKAVNEEEIDKAAQSLKDKVSKYEAIAKLAQNPLLCAMICALHYSKKGLLPTKRLELYDACCQMLLSERDQLRTIHSERFSLIETFEYEDKRRVLGDLALWMLNSGGALLVDYEDAASRLQYKMTFMKSASGYSEKEAAEVSKLLLDYFIERGGILRWVEERKIGFIHKTFQEYFAAYQIYLESSWTLITHEDHAIDTNWRETILLATAFSSKEGAERVIRHYLEKSSFETKQPNVQMIYRILAINCASMARELSPHTSQIIEKETKVIVPPNSEDHIRALSACGNLVVPLLEYNPQYTENNIHDCVTVLSRVQTSQSISQIAEYLDKKSESAYNVLNQYWRYLSRDTIVNANIVPSYVRAIMEHSVSMRDGQALVGKIALMFFEQIASFCTVDKNNNNEYYLSEVMATRLRAKFSRLRSLKIENHWLENPCKNHAIIKMLNLFSIGKNISSIIVSYDGEDINSEVTLFCSQFHNYKKLASVSIFGLSERSKELFEKELKHYRIENVKLTIQRNKMGE